MVLVSKNGIDNFFCSLRLEKVSAYMYLPGNITAVQPGALSPCEIVCFPAASLFEDAEVV